MLGDEVHWVWNFEGSVAYKGPWDITPLVPYTAVYLVAFRSKLRPLPGLVFQGCSSLSWWSETPTQHNANKHSSGLKSLDATWLGFTTNWGFSACTEPFAALSTCCSTQDDAWIILTCHTGWFMVAPATQPSATHFCKHFQNEGFMFKAEDLYVNHLNLNHQSPSTSSCLEFEGSFTLGLMVVVVVHWLCHLMSLHDTSYSNEQLHSQYHFMTLGIQVHLLISLEWVYSIVLLGVFLCRTMVYKSTKVYTNDTWH